MTLPIPTLEVYNINIVVEESERQLATSHQRDYCISTNAKDMSPTRQLHSR
jgi:hypothetical protein